MRPMYTEYKNLPPLPDVIYVCDRCKSMLVQPLFDGNEWGNHCYRCGNDEPGVRYRRAPDVAEFKNKNSWTISAAQAAQISHVFEKALKETDTMYVQSQDLREECLQCGSHETIEQSCKILCTECGSKRDCTDP